MRLVATTLLLTSACAAQAATYTSSANAADVFGSNTPIDAFGTNSFASGVSVNTQGSFFAPKGVTTGVVGGVFSDVVTDDAANGGHAKSVFTFSHAITAFGALWDTAYANSQPGSGLRIDIGNDGSYEFDSASILPTTLTGSFYGFASDTPFTTFAISYRDVYPQQETYRVSDMQFTSAVPEPETAALLLAGLGMLGFMGRRRTLR